MKSRHTSILAFALALGVSPFALGGIAAAQESPQPQAPETMQGTEGSGDRCAQPNPPADCPAGSAAGKPAASGGSETTGAISSSDVDITAEQKTELRTVIQEGDAKPVDSVDFNVSVGTAVPESVTLQTLPPRVIEIVPAYREYRYFVLADGRIVIVNPGDMKIVAVIS
ncbi:MAG TPA: DUF1236 domain-containing protein [Sinorhizobium sp.]|nr:DUF1236 domain-containing protein [Sinorhizobium sp.]